MAFYRASAAVFTGVVCNIRVIVPCSRKTPEGAGGPLSGVFLSSPDISEIRGQKSEARSQRSEVRNSLVGAAFSRDLAISTISTPFTV
jgi:hypothetical protein